MSLPILTDDQRFVLQWLAIEDESALGECRGAALSTLVAKGFAEISNAARGDWAGVSITPRGLDALAQAQP